MTIDILAQPQDDSWQGGNIPGWLCPCGHWEDSDFHCSHCGREPPWGCDCSDCHDRDLERYGEEEYFPGPWDD